MISLQRILAKDEKFFDLLEKSADEVQKNVLALVALVKSPDPVWRMDSFNETRRNETHIANEITEELCKTFVTPLEREDIESLSSALYKIPKNLEKFAERVTAFESYTHNGLSFEPQASILEMMAETMSQMIKSLRKNPKLDVIKGQNNRMLALEAEGDKLMLELTKDLYQQHGSDPLKCYIMRDLFDLLERAIDRFRDAASIVFRIVLKNS
jgi:uncharacterized protein Yka (UPF0111/DUF47 family)